ncbi:MAG TPA: 50S ribosomal protein L15 [Candidatus Saccharimonadales bacterium]|nr:50S ribosomal protein L15 [Candidatus Saccharimonadales bacterium]
MKYNELILSRQKNAKRAGRGISAGRGKTAGRGTKGQGSRKSPVKQGFEGGQMPLHMRLPKLRGFNSRRPNMECVYTEQLEQLKKPAIDTTVLFEAGLISSPHVGVKLLAKGELKSKKIVKLQSASGKAIEMIEKAGGSFSRTDRLPRQPKKSAAAKA